MVFSILYLLIGVYIASVIYKMGTFGIIFPICICLFWLPMIVILSLSFGAMFCFPSIIMKCLGWKITNEFPNVEKSIIVVAPHTSSIDALLGKIILLAAKIKHKILSSAHLFKFPLNIFMEKGLQAIPIGGVPGKNAILEVAEYLNKNNTNIIICPEGQLAATDKWNPGFYYMSYKSNTPIVLAKLDYINKTISFSENVIDTTKLNLKETYNIIREYYKDANPKHPEKFMLPRQ